MDERPIWLPDWLVDENLWKQTDRSNEAFRNLSWIKESRAKLESTELDDNQLYYSQIWTVKECLSEAFWEHAQYIRIVNRIFLVIQWFMSAYHDYSTFEWEKEWSDWEDIESMLDWKKRRIIDYVVDYWYEAIERINEELSYKDERRELLSEKFQALFSLLTERVEYVEPQSD